MCLNKSGPSSNHFRKTCFSSCLQCYCHNDATCNPVDGQCKCQPGFTGSRCEEYCPEGYWGRDCLRACQCPSSNYVCDPVKGCVCRPGFAGVDCATPAAAGAVSGSSDSNYPLAIDEGTSDSSVMNADRTGAAAAEPGTIAGTVVVFLLVFVICVIMFYCRFVSTANFF